MKADDFLAIAESIGQRIARQAIWQGAACTWEIQTSDRTNASRSQASKATGTLYQGSSGIAWFLAELAAVTDNPELARVAEGGLQHALVSGQTLPDSSFGFHTGRVGIAWVATRAARLFDREDFAQAARDLLEPLWGHELQDRGLDVIAGAAGAIPALLDLGTTLDWPMPKASAVRLGEHLIERAHREPKGWSWAMMSDTVIRHLTGLAHGAAGAGLALLELARATGEARFLFAAEMAFLYERQFFNPATANWPDLRNSELGNYLFYEGQREALLQHAREGTLPANKIHYMAAWCHGSPGIGLSRLRAHELTGQELYRWEAEAALISTLESLVGEALEHNNFSLCHGIAGNCALPLIAAERFDQPRWRQTVMDAAIQGWERYEKNHLPWPCGTVNSVADPSLLIGEAGIGLFYLTLARPETPSPLLLEPEHRKQTNAETTIPNTKTKAELVEQARRSADDFFATSRRVTERLTGVPAWTPKVDDEPLLEAPAEALYKALVQRIETADKELRPLLEEAVQLDRERWQATCAIDDFTAEFVRALTHRAWSALEPDAARFERAPDSRMLLVRRPWDRWAAEDASPTVLSPEDLPQVDEVHVLLYRQDHRIHKQPLGVFAALLLDLLDQPKALEELVDDVAEALDGPVDREPLKAKILPQLKALYRAGFVVEASSRETA